jgi:hypothetical protein
MPTCGCSIRSELVRTAPDGSWSESRLHINYCPLHAAAPDLLAKARAVSQEWDAYIGRGDEEGHDDPVLVGECIGDLRDAIASAKGSS